MYYSNFSGEKPTVGENGGFGQPVIEMAVIGENVRKLKLMKLIWAVLRLINMLRSP